MPDPEHVATVHMEGEASRLSPPRGVQGLCRKLEPGTARQQLKELRIKEVARQAPGENSKPEGNTRFAPGTLLLFEGTLQFRRSHHC